MLNLFLFLSIAFLLTFAIGRIIEKINVPWIFAALILGFLLAIYNPFAYITNSSEFNFLAYLGMYFLLFIIGLEIDLNKLKKQGKFIFKATFFIILFESLFGTLLVHFVFGYAWFISFVVALSFATVGEAILIPILDEFKIVNSKLGQAIIGIGTLDDIIEVLTLITAILLISSSAAEVHINTALILISLFVLFALAFGLTKFREEGRKFSSIDIEDLFLFIIFIFFLFLGIGEYAYSTAVAALLSGLALKTFLPEKRLQLIESEVRTMCYGFFAPIFFLWAGSSINIKYLASYPLFIVLVILVSGIAKILGSWLIGRNELGTKKSIMLGIGISVRFSTSIIIIKILFENSIIHSGLYSVILASTIVFTFIIPILFSNLLANLNINNSLRRK